MVGRVITLGALVALAQAKAIVTNLCKHDVYLWSVPIKVGVADRLSISPDKRYEEPWRYGTFVNPGIAIKISDVENGIYTGKTEIDFQYNVDQSDPGRVFIDIQTIRGDALTDVTLYGCNGPYQGRSISTRPCAFTDDVELVLCGSERTTPEHDSTPPETIIDCIGTLQERDAVVRPRQCNARVVGPTRLSKIKPKKAGRADDKRPATIPLKTVMRHEAAKHAAPRAVDAHEKEIQDTAEANCCHANPRRMDALDGPHIDINVPVPDPDIGYDNETDNALEARRELKTTMCIERANQKMFKFWGNLNTIYQEMNDMFSDVDWTEDETICRWNRTVKPRGEKSKRCVLPYCGPSLSDVDCKGVKKQLEKLSKDAGKKIDWTTDDEACGPPFIRTELDLAGPYFDAICVWPYEATFDKYWGLNRTHHVLDDAFEEASDIDFTSDDDICTKTDIKKSQAYHHKIAKKEKKTRHCVMPFCKPYGADCSDVEDELEKVSKDVGKHWDWTTDDDACGEEVKRSVINTHHASKRSDDYSRGQDLYQVCALDPILRLAKYWDGDVDETMNRLEEIFPKIPFSFAPYDCDRNSIKQTKQFYHKLINNKDKRIQRCVMPYCDSRKKGDCSDVEDALEKVSKDLGVNYDWTTDDDSCGSHVFV